MEMICNSSYRPDCYSKGFFPAVVRCAGFEAVILVESLEHHKPEILKIRVKDASCEN